MCPRQIRTCRTSAFLDGRRKTIEVTSGAVAQVNFQLKLATVRQEVTVTATGKEENILETFASVSSLSGQQLITRANAPALGEMLDHRAGNRETQLWARDVATRHPRL